jgi:hypothetical protein
MLLPQSDRSQPDETNHLLKIVVGLLKLIVKEQIVLRELEIPQVEFLDNIVSQYVGYTG